MSSKNFRLSLVLTVLYLIILSLIAPFFFEIVQHRDGFLLPDPVLNLLPALDVSFFIFFILYVLITIVILYSLQDPLLLLRGLQAYALIATIRFGTMFFISLEPPPGLVDMQDPLVALFFYGQISITKDLFFSGHASVLFLFFFLIKNKLLRYCLLIGSIGISILLLIQHIHYTYDVLAAPLFAFGAYKVSGVMSSWFNYPEA